MKANKEHRKCGIYCIKNTVNNKVYIGKSKNHSQKLSKSWQNDFNRKKNQSELFSKTLTKYKYRLFTIQNTFVEDCNFKRLQELKLQNCITKFHKKKTDKIKFKLYFIERLTIEDIVRHSE